MLNDHPDTTTALLAPSPVGFTSLMESPCVTVGDLCRRYLAWHLPAHTQASTGQQEASKILRYFWPLYDYQLAGPTRPLVKAAVVAWHTSLGSRYPHAANGCLDTLSSILKRGLEWGLYHGPDLAAGIQRFPEHSRRRFLSESEWEQVKRTLLQQPVKVRVYFFLLLLEGSRKDELREAQWAHFDLPGKMWYKPTTKNGEAEHVEITEQSVQLLQLLPHLSRFVFTGDPGQNGTKLEQAWSATAVTWWWRKVRKAAGVPDVRIHDLRRTFATRLMMETGDLLLVQHALNHASLDSTRIYCRHVPFVIRGAKEKLAGKILGTTDVTAPAAGSRA